MYLHVNIYDFRAQLKIKKVESQDMLNICE